MKFINKKIIVLMSVFLLSLSLYAKAKNIMYVAVNSASLKVKASKFAKESAILEYGTAAIVIDEKGDWYFICDSNDETKKGWIPSSALSKKKVLASSSTTADAKEIALAGKGFSSSIESTYAKEFNVDYSDVDYVESQSVSDKELQSFIVEGQLNSGEDNE